jgi:hypothetical protein
MPIVDAGATAARSGFPVGGRPLEWRALEEAAAFAKWFEQRPEAPSAAPRSAPEAAARASSEGGIVRAGHAGLRPTEIAATEPGGACAPAAAGSRARVAPPAIRLAQSFAGAAAGQASTQPALRKMEVMPGARPVAAGRSTPEWTATAAMSVLEEQDQVRVWLRDFDLMPADARQLGRQLIAALRLLGYHLAALVVNGVPISGQGQSK